jgi:diadenosine tetraphosphatase ApaH/serine/threonine PP2A family protein phosphatase
VSEALTPIKARRRPSCYNDGKGEFREPPLLIAFIADVHANRQAFSACLEQARARGAERIVLLGDYVGYGADPEWAVRTAMDLVGKGAVAVLGNHDCAVGDTSERMNPEAQIVMEWTRGQLGPAERAFLAGLPLQAREEDRLYVHAEASAPKRWLYVTSREEAYRSLAATDARLTFCGHTHEPAVYSLSVMSKITAFCPVTDVPVPLFARRRWLVVVGSAGQPRDGNPAASFAMFDTERREITFRRAPYHVDDAAAAIRANGLPECFADRLYEGR